MHERIQIKDEKKEKGDKWKKEKTRQVWFCKAFQTDEGHNKESNHWGKFAGKDRFLQHICAACWLKEKQKKSHSKSSAYCPQKEQ